MSEWSAPKSRAAMTRVRFPLRTKTCRLPTFGWKLRPLSLEGAGRYLEGHKDEGMWGSSVSGWKPQALKLWPLSITLNATKQRGPRGKW